MQTANGKLLKTENQIPTIKARMMDKESQQTCVTEETVKQTKLNPSSRESYAVFAFAFSKVKQICTLLFVFDLKLDKGKNLTITASIIQTYQEKF